MLKKVMIIVTAVILLSVNLLILAECPKKYGFELGFSHLDKDAMYHDIFIAVKSEKSIFDMDDVTFDLYYGTTTFEIPVETERYEPVCVAVYHQILWGGTAVLFGDYKNSGRFQIIKEISLEKFYGGDYVVTSEPEKTLGEWSAQRYTFSHSEKFTVPNEYFVYSQGSFYLYASVVYFDKELGKYSFFGNEYTIFEETWSIVTVGYTLLENGKVRL